LFNVQNLIESNNFLCVLSELAKFNLLKKILSVLKAIVIYKRDIVIAKVFCLQNNSAKTQELFQRLLRNNQKLYNRTNRNLIVYLVNIYCELDNPAETERIIVIILNNSKNYNQDRYLQILLTEIYLYQKSFRIAKNIC